MYSRSLAAGNRVTPNERENASFERDTRYKLRKRRRRQRQLYVRNSNSLCSIYKTSRTILRQRSYIQLYYAAQCNSIVKLRRILLKSCKFFRSIECYVKKGYIFMNRETMVVIYVICAMKFAWKMRF